jgi:hypothetical protein
MSRSCSASRYRGRKLSRPDPSGEPPALTITAAQMARQRDEPVNPPFLPSWRRPHPASHRCAFNPPRTRGTTASARGAVARTTLRMSQQRIDCLYPGGIPCSCTRLPAYCVLRAVPPSRISFVEFAFSTTNRTVYTLRETMSARHLCRTREESRDTYRVDCAGVPRGHRRSASPNRVSATDAR